MRHLAIVTVVSWVAAGCQCRPSVSNGETANPTETDPPTPEETADTAPEPPCANPETEPNNSAADASFLPMDVEGCGEFQVVADSDFWTFDVVATTWLGVRVDANENGSFANPSVLLTNDAGLAIVRSDGSETADVDLLFPADPGTYTVTVLEENQSGADDGRYFYDILATVQKSPRDWTVTEIEPNDNRPNAMEVFDGDQIYGRIEDGDDVDFFQIDVPAGRHTLTLSVDGFDLGSPCDTELQLSYLDGEHPTCVSNPSCTFSRGEIGFERDPWLQHTSEGDETLYVRVSPDDGRGSDAHWYVFDVVMEGTD